MLASAASLPQRRRSSRSIAIFSSIRFLNLRIGKDRMSRLPSVSIPAFLVATAFLAPIARAQTPACHPGFVLREAFPGDSVCVTPETHAQVIADNRDAMLHRISPNKETCVQGYAWREASPQDHVCVPVATHMMTQQDNRLAATRMMAAEPVPAAPTATTYAQQSGPPPNRIVLSSDQVLPGFRVSTNPLPTRSAPVHLHPRPAPLTGQQINSAVGQYRLHVVGMPMPIAPDITYQLELFDNNSGSEVNTNAVESSVFYGSGNGVMGYIQVTYNVSPGAQHLLDCSLGQDGSFRVITMFLLTNGNASSAESTIGSFSGHLLIPFNPAPSNVKNAQAIIYFDNIEFDGCTVETVSQ
jgi:hypothetical protein